MIFFACSEIALRAAYLLRNAMVLVVPLPYAIGDDYGPLPPWLDRLVMLVPDDALIWRNLPNVHRTYLDVFAPVRSERDRMALLRRFMPAIPSAFRSNPTWTVELNSQGFRSGEYTPHQPAHAIRIACIGDSWTFGMNVDQDRTYPSRLRARLHESSAGADVEVMNFGVLGYSSFQGLQLLKTRVLGLAPDVLVIGFGMNDSEMAGYRDKDMISTSSPGMAARALETAGDLEFFRLLKYSALLLRFHPRPVDEYIRNEAEAKSETIDYDALEPWTRVSLRDYESNIREMIRLQAAQGGAAILLDNELWEESPYRPVLRQISADMHVPLVDSLRIVAAAKQSIERELEMHSGLAVHDSDADDHRQPASGPDLPDAGVVRVVFRVSHGSVAVPRALSIAGTDAELGALVPNAIEMHDDGRDGDERAGDGVWSYEARLRPGAHIFYVYTNSGARGDWEGLDVPSIRRVTIPATPGAGRVYLPIDTFGELYMQADNWHTNAEGYERIAAAVAKEINRQLHPAFGPRASRTPAQTPRRAWPAPESGLDR